MRRSLGKIAFIVLGLFALLELRVLPGFIAPPALLPAPGAQGSITDFPAGTSALEVALPSGERLRGVFVPSDPGAPVILHLLESSGSAFTKPFGYIGGLYDFSNVGFASVMLDYRGVGKSDGSRSITHLEDDAWAMWNEALARAGGDPSLVVVRGVSIGTLAAAALARRGARPAAWMLIDPVRASTVVENFGRREYGAVLARLAAPFFRRPIDLELEDVVATLDAPLRVVSPRDDFLLAAPEQELVRASVARVGGAWVWSEDDHVFTAGHARHLRDMDEAAFLRRLFADWPDPFAREARVLEGLERGLRERVERDSAASARLHELATWSLRGPPRVIALAALTAVEPLRVVRLAQRPDSDPCRELELDDCEHWLDRRDPSGDLPLEWIGVTDLILLRDPPIVLDECPTLWPAPLAIARAIEAQARNGAADFVVRTPEGSLSYPINSSELWSALERSGDRDVASTRRRLLRVVLKALRIPERVVCDGSSARLEVRLGGAWQAVDANSADVGAESR